MVLTWAETSEGRISVICLQCGNRFAFRLPEYLVNNTARSRVIYEGWINVNAHSIVIADLII